jgi:hypothetical protein
MSFTYVQGTDIGKVRLLVPDRELAYMVFTDEELQEFIDLYPANLWYAAAEAVDTIAASQTMILKVVSRLDVSTDGAAVGRELRQRANRLRETGDDMAGADVSDVSTIEMLLGDFSIREQIVNAGLRDD